MTTVLLTGINGQLGSYLADLLVEKGYQVHGIIRRASSINTSRIDHLLFSPPQKIMLHYGDIADANSIVRILREVNPDMVFNIASMSHVRISFELPEYTMQVTGIGPLRILEALHSLEMKNVRFLQMSSSEMYGITPPPQDENSVFRPQSPYGVAKLAAYYLTKIYRTGYGMFACNAICFNNESPRRGENFVTQKICRGAVRIKLGIQDKLQLGNLDAKRDWGASWEYADAVYRIMTHSEPDDFCISSEEYYSVREFLEMVFKRLNLSIDEHVIIQDRLMRPNEVPELRGSSKKAHDILGWKPKVKLPELIDIMLDAVMEDEKKKLYLKQQDEEKERLKL